MTTFGDLVASIHSSLHSYTGVIEQVTWLTAALDSTATTVQVADSDAVTRGISEIDDELVYVTSSDGGGLTLPPFGRGYRGSTATSHLIDAPVTVDPAFPRVEIKRAINQCVQAMFPALWAVKTTDIVYDNMVQVGYALPSDAEGVIEVKVKNENDPEDYWAPLNHWEFDPSSPDGRVLNITIALRPGADIRVVYQGRFGEFTDDADTLEDKGLQETFADLILYSVTARMVRFLDPARLQVASVENLSRSQVVQTGDAGKLANQLYAMYQQRLIEERRRLLELQPIRPNYLAR